MSAEHLSRCAQESDDAAEPLAGTAAEVRRWIGVESPAPWSAKGFPDVDLSSEALGVLLRQRALGARVQLIRRPAPPEVEGDTAPSPLRVLIADGDPPALWGFRLSTLSDLVALPWDDLWAGGGPAEARITTPVLLVCTHGRRDRCCALAGTATYLALAAAAPPSIEVWQTTHLGGHRFAATLLSLPEGICYGRLTPAEAPALLAALSAQQPYDLARWRGRCAWPPPAQVAEIHLRQQHPRSSLALQSCLSQGDARWRVTLTRTDPSREGTVTVSVAVEEHPLPVAIRKSCGDAVRTPTAVLRVVSG